MPYPQETIQKDVCLIFNVKLLGLVPIVSVSDNAKAGDAFQFPFVNIEFIREKRI